MVTLALADRLFQWEITRVLRAGTSACGHDREKAYPITKPLWFARSSVLVHLSFSTGYPLHHVMEQTRGLMWRGENQTNPSSSDENKRRTSVGAYFIAKAHDQSCDVTFNWPKSAILIQLCEESDRWHTVDGLRRLLDIAPGSKRVSQLVREIIEELETLPGVHFQPAQPKDKHAGDDPLPKGERKMGTWTIPVLDGELTLERKTSGLRLSHRKTAGTTERQEETTARQTHVPRRLPPLPSGFVERAHNVTRLRAQKPVQGPLLIGLYGMGGSGKTTLALALAHGLKAAFPDGQLYLPLAKMSASSRQQEDEEVKRWLEAAIRAFGVQQQLPSQIDELANQYRDTLSSREVLILLDNVQSPTQIQPFEPPVGCALIVVSRQTFSLGAAQVHLVGAMSDKEAKNLLLGLYAHLTIEQVESLVRLCAHLPLALRIAGGCLQVQALKREGRTDVEGFIEKMKAMRLATLDGGASYSVQDSVTATLLLSEEGLTPEQKQAWWRLSVFPADFEAQAAHAVAALSEEALEELADRSLVECSKSRYRLHDLVRDYTRERLAQTPDEERDARLRHARHYVSQARQKNLAFLQGGENTSASLAWFDQERGNIEAAQAWAQTWRDQLPEAAQLCVEFPQAASQLLGLRLPPRVEIEWLLSALHVCESCEHPSQQDQENFAATLHNLGLCHSKLGDMEKAIAFYTRSLTLITALKHPPFEVICRSNLGWAYQKSNRKAEAMEQYRLSVEASNGIDDPQRRRRARVEALLNQGILHKNEEEYDLALRCYNEVLRVVSGGEDPRIEAKAQGNIGVVFYLQSDFYLAIAHFEEQYNIAHEIGDTVSQASALYNNALATYELKERRRAIDLAAEALVLYKLLDDPMTAEVEESLQEWRQEGQDATSGSSYDSPQD